MLRPQLFRLGRQVERESVSASYCEWLCGALSVCRQTLVSLRSKFLFAKSSN